MPPRPYRIGWVLDASPRRVIPLPWDGLSPVGKIRYGGIAQHLNQAGHFQMERYRPWTRYDAVVFVKMMSDRAFQEAQKLKRQGVPVLFDTNVNYYEEWGDFPVPGTRPTSAQKVQARRMTELADAVVADSSYLKTVCDAINPQTVWIPDAVDSDHYRPGTAALPEKPLRLIWSGIGKKAYHLELIEELLQRTRDRIALTLIPSRPSPKDPPAAVLNRLVQHAHAKILYWDEPAYVTRLQQSHVIISPKILNNSYEMAHTEYKISLGMAVGLPALASPQPSYQEILCGNSGGQICATVPEWENAFQLFLDQPALLVAQSQKARETVIARYSIPVVAQQYSDLLNRLCAR